MQTSFACEKTTGKKEKMAIYSCSVKTMSRSSGRSATAAAAYRSGTEITDKKTGEVHNYKNKGINGVEESNIILPPNAPDRFHDRSELWNEAEASEKRKNSVVAREVMVALPHEVDREARKKMVDEYAQGLSDRYQVGVDYSIHTPDRKGDQRNYHAHIMMTTRRIDEHGFGEKTRELDAYKSTGKMEINNIRQTWEQVANKYLELANSEARIDSRSYQDQGVEKIPTKHVGVAGTSIDRKGETSTRKALNDEIKRLNSDRQDAAERLMNIRAEKAQVQSEMRDLERKYRSVSKQEKQSEQLVEAVDLAHERAGDINWAAKENFDQYKGYHKKKIEEQADRIKRIDAMEPRKKRFERQSTFEKRHAEWEKLKKNEWADIHQKIQKHSQPEKYSESADRARGQIAREKFIKKSKIQEAFHDQSAQKKLDELKEKKNMIKEKIEQKQAEAKGLDAKQTRDQERLSDLKSKIADRKRELDNSGGSDGKKVNEIASNESALRESEKNHQVKAHEVASRQKQIEATEKGLVDGEKQVKLDETREKVKQQLKEKQSEDKSKESSKDDSLGF